MKIIHKIWNKCGNWQASIIFLFILFLIQVFSFQEMTIYQKALFLFVFIIWWNLRDLRNILIRFIISEVKESKNEKRN